MVRTIGEDAGVADTEEPEVKPGIFTSEFWTTVSGLIVNVLVVMAAIGYVSQTDADKLTSSISAVIGALQILIVNGAVIWGYVKSRASVKAEQIRGQYQLLSTLLHLKVERERLQMEMQMHMREAK
jgi:hypothetical protein